MPAAPPMKYVLGYRSQTLTLNPNPITDPNHKINKKQNDIVVIRESGLTIIELELDTGMKLNIELYLKVDFPGTGPPSLGNYI